VWQEKSLEVGQSRGWGEGAQGKNAGDHAAHLIIGRDQSLGVQLAERGMESPLIRPQLSQAVQGEVDALTDADSCGAREQEGICVQILAICRGKRHWESRRRKHNAVDFYCIRRHISGGRLWILPEFTVW
jgi:hypothetical protein